MKSTNSGKKKLAKPKEERNLKEDIKKENNNERIVVDFAEVMQKILRVAPEQKTKK